MANEYKLSYTASEIDAKLGQVDAHEEAISSLQQEFENKSDEFEQIQSDYNQNDETAFDYIKNRPFYEHKEVLLDNITVNNGDTLDIEFEKEGDVITVIWDGVSSEKIVEQCEVMSGRWTLPYYTIGNQSLLNDDSNTFEDTGETYLIQNQKGGSVTTISCDDGLHILSIIKSSITKIDSKFMPDNVIMSNPQELTEEQKSQVLENIGGQSKIAGKKGQLVGFDISGNAVAIDSDTGVNSKEKSPVTLARFFYNLLTNIPADTFEEKAQWLARYDVFVYQAYLSNDLTMSKSLYDDELAIYQRALEINPDLKVFGYLTARGFAFDNDTNEKVGMTEYRTSPSNVDHPIFTKEELFAYLNLMAHCGGTKTDEVDEYGNPVLTGGIPLYGVFFDDYGYNIGSRNDHLMNQGDWSSVREKQNALIDYAHSLGLSVMANSSPDDIFSYTSTSSYFNPNGEYSHMGENDWFCLESYFLRSDNTYALNNDDHASIYRENYKDIYHSKSLALTYLSSVDVEDNEAKQIASTFATYQALCQGVNSIAIHGTSMYMEIPSDFYKYYTADDSAVYTSDVDNGTYTLSVNGHTVMTTRSIAKTAYGQVPNVDTLSSCKITIDGSHIFNNGYLRTEEVLYELNELENEMNKKISEINLDFTENSNLYHRVFIDDWDNTYLLSDYTNYATTFKNAFGGEDTGATSTYDASRPYDTTIRLPQNWSWRRVLMDVTDLKGKTVEIGFASCNVYAENDSTQHPNLTWQVIGNCESNSWTSITAFNTNSVSTSVDGVDRCCARFTVPEDIKELIFWCQRNSDTPSGAWIVDIEGVYIVDPSEHEDDVVKTWFTNYAPHASQWRVNGTNNTITRSEEGLTAHYTSLTASYETTIEFPANGNIFKAGETWELGVKNLRMLRDDGFDVTNKLCIVFNLGDELGNTYIALKSYSDYKSVASKTGDDSLIPLIQFTIPESYTGGMPKTPIYFYPLNYAGGDSDGFYNLTVEGLYLYNIDERDELLVRGEDPSKTYIKINRINEYDPDETLEPDSIYIVESGSMFVTNRKREKIDISGSSTSGNADVSNKVSLPKDDSGNIQYGTVGQFAVSDGNGGITWMTIINGSEVAW